MTPDPDLLPRVAAALPPALPVWLVGGAVRDRLLGRRTHDLDFAVDGDGLAAARAIANALGGSYYPLDTDRGVGRVLLEAEAGRLSLDFARLRGPTLAADLGARDFTVNAIAAPIADPQSLIDPLGGQADLRSRLIRACGPASLADDPVRGVRAVRLAAQLNFRIEPATRAAIRATAGALGRVSAERRRDEFVRCLALPRPAAPVRALEALGLLAALVPELLATRGVALPASHTGDLWDYTLGVVTRLAELLDVLRPSYDMDAASDVTLALVAVRLGRHRQVLGEHLGVRLAADRPARWLLLLAALLHTIGRARAPSTADSPATSAALAADRLAQLAFSNEEIRRVRLTIAYHAQLAQLAATGRPPTGREIYRFFKDAGEAGVGTVLLALAGFLAGYSDQAPPVGPWNALLDVASGLLRAYFEMPGVSVRPPPLLTGDDLMAALGLRPGPRLGLLLEALREAQAAGEVTSRDQALAWARSHLG